MFGVCGDIVYQGKGVCQDVCLLVARQQRDSRKPESQYFLQGHTPNNPICLHTAPLNKVSTISR